MRQIPDMRPSLASVVMIYAGALALVFGLSAAVSSAQSGSAWLFGCVALGGAIAWIVGHGLRRPSQEQAYRHYLQAQEMRDLLDACAEASLDVHSREALESEIARRRRATKG